MRIINPKHEYRIQYDVFINMRSCHTFTYWTKAKRFIAEQDKDTTIHVDKVFCDLTDGTMTRIGVKGFKTTSNIEAL